ncbi:Sir2 family NAD-dependent protein deacetylase [Herbaspirillum sp. SJZ107]|uniref:SIR2 family NAD-dependent protein deacylase n=1 Tax=Herbaspirillum sp. SJZ107 TaxID=2572881 RepID=UPI0021028D31|nr:Sir2 family NAD-dependent protein deacetylase [Herbaspirillum sp. SJZ107]
MPALDPAVVAQAAELIARADSIIIAAGAGMGVDSGLPDFRGNAGFWREYPALAADGTAFMDIASPLAFHAEPRRAWGFYGHRLALYRGTAPHHGHVLLRQWAEAAQYGAFVFTSNVDGHFEKAGFDPLQVDECHGSIHHLQCLAPCCDMVWSASSFVPLVDESRCELLSPLPVCARCGGPARPNILMFNDSGWIGDRHGRRTARLRGWLERTRRPVVIELGAGTAISTVRHFSHRMVRQHNAALIRINPRAPLIGNLPGVAIAGGALEVLSAIDRHMEQAR